jgi:Domain of unknown function (DUF4261)
VVPRFARLRGSLCRFGKAMTDRTVFEMYRFCHASPALGRFGGVWPAPSAQGRFETTAANGTTLSLRYRLRWFASPPPRCLTLHSSGDLHRHGTWPASPWFLSSASRAKRHTGSGPSAQTLGLMSTTEILLCVPGPWADRTAFIRSIVTLEPKGRYMFAGLVLADVAAKDHVPLELHPADPHMEQAFSIPGQGRLSQATLDSVRSHNSVAYIRFPADLFGQLPRIRSFSSLLRTAGGIAVKVESSGVSHEWHRWETLLAGTAFDQYCAVVTLVGDDHYYYSCGMHSFGAPDCEAPTSLPAGEAADLMNRFNFWQLVESPVLQSGHTFSVSPDHPRFVLTKIEDARHEPDDPFFNPAGLWRLDEA